MRQCLPCRHRLLQHQLAWCSCFILVSRKCAAAMMSVLDPVRARAASGRFARAEIRFQIVCATDKLATDEDLRPSATAGNRPQSARCDMLAEADFTVVITPVSYTH